MEASVGLTDGMKKIISAMKSEFENRNLMLDHKWNDYCNVAIYYAYKNGRLSEQDRETVEAYINNGGKAIFALSIKRMKKYKIKDALYAVKSEIERAIKKLVR